MYIEDKNLAIFKT